ncbi:metallophosphoesterase [Terrisporobacter vanillatitrophus]|uniref:metallophosphoesterase n=1 Tax=Terrisporobacter vanillatitrophus TaxID=3058402 RepID=UPI00336925E9
MNKLEIANYVIENKKIPREFNDYVIVQISDLHNRSFGKNNINLINEIDKINPQVVFITGDIIDGENKNFQVALNLLENLTNKYQVYYITGNHEQKALIKRYKELYKEYFKKLQYLSAIHLDNEKIQIKKDKSHINIYGLTVPFKCYKYLFDKDKSIYLDKSFLQNNLPLINKNEYNILLVHTPFYFDEYEKWGSDLILAGHVHGGIIRLPIIGGLLSPNRQFFPKYDLGKFDKNNSTMIVTKGLGRSKVLVRINCKPEVVKITLKSKHY